MECPFCKKEIYAMTGFQEIKKFQKHLEKCKKNPKRKTVVEPDGDKRKQWSIKKIKVMGEILPDGTIQSGYSGYCPKCKKTITTNIQGNETGTHICKMSLFNKLKEIVNDGYAISFNSELFQLKIKVQKVIYEQGHTKESWLPLNDHFYEEKIVDCIDYMVGEIKK